jgi:CheY-like chemotaxis protein
MARRGIANGAERRIMVVDDGPLALELMRDALARLGFSVVCRQDGRVALREIGSHRPHAIVLDLLMPNFDGLDVLDGLDHLPAWRHTPVFLWTSMRLSEQEYASLARSAHAIVGRGGGDLRAMLGQLGRTRSSSAVM